MQEIISSGFVIIQDNKILLCHPTNSPWWNTYSFPKGRVEVDEDIDEAAIRETKEEVGLDISEYMVKLGDKGMIQYTNKPKKVYYQVVYCQGIDKTQLKLQKEEVDWAGFMDKKEV